MNSVPPRRAMHPVALALVALALAGCASGSGSPAHSSSASASVAVAAAGGAASTPTETAPVPAPTAGASISTDAEAAAAKAAGLGVFDIYDADGNYTNSIVFDKAAPLPDPIKAAIAAPAKAAYDAAMATGISGDQRTAEQVAALSSVDATATTKAQAASEKSGRNIVIVYPTYGSADGGKHWGTVYCATSAEGGIRKSVAVTAADSAAVAQAWIATQPVPASYEIVVVG